jgi:hypothetical protein
MILQDTYYCPKNVFIYDRIEKIGECILYVARYGADEKISHYIIVYESTRHFPFNTNFIFKSYNGAIDYMKRKAKKDK